MRGLYVITDEVLTPKADMFSMVESSLKGGAKFVQLRDKNSSYDELLNISKELKPLVNRYGAKYIINDNLELAIESNADGLHIGRDDTELKEARVRLDGKIIGVSCYGDIDRALKMESLGADYVAFGSFFVSPTKPKSGVVDMSIVAKARERLNIPICVIGGLKLESSRELISLGADMVAIISDIWNSEDIENRANNYSKLFQ
jgi:thiamine-phosphate pyrophosphorylase